MVTGYLNVPGYANYQRRLCRDELLQPMWDARSSGDRRAPATVADDVVDDLLVHGTPVQCREAIRHYVDNGVTVPVIICVDPGSDTDPLDDTVALAPSHS